MLYHLFHYVKYNRPVSADSRGKQYCHVTNNTELSVVQTGLLTLSIIYFIIIIIIIIVIPLNITHNILHLVSST